MQNMKASTSSHENLPTVPQVELQRSASTSRIPIIPVSPKPKKRQALGQNARYVEATRRCHVGGV